MTKQNELDDPRSCFNKARMDERMFVTLERDVAAPGTIRFWITERIRLGKNKKGDSQLVEAEKLAMEIETWLISNG
jgi:hypothetical protein